MRWGKIDKIVVLVVFLYEKYGCTCMDWHVYDYVGSTASFSRIVVLICCKKKKKKKELMSLDLQYQEWVHAGSIHFDK
jgi:hypothetical protein